MRILVILMISYYDEHTVDGVFDISCKYARLFGVSCLQQQTQRYKSGEVISPRRRRRLTSEQTWVRTYEQDRTRCL